MSRQPRAGTAGRNVTIRATDEERMRWLQLAGLSGASLSEWIRTRLNRHVTEFEGRFGVKLKRPGGKHMENTARSRRNPRRAKR